MKTNSTIFYKRIMDNTYHLSAMLISGNTLKWNACAGNEFLDVNFFADQKTQRKCTKLLKNWLRPASHESNVQRLNRLEKLLCYCSTGHDVMKRLQTNCAV